MANTLPYVICDVDGTITSKFNVINSDIVKDILLYQKKSKGHFGIITTGLDVTKAKIIKDLKITLPVISCNGALISDPTKNWNILYVEYLDKQASINILRRAAEAKLNFLVCEPGALCGLRNTSRAEYWNDYRDELPKKYDFKLKIFDTIDELVEDISEERTRPIEIMLISDSHEQAKAVKENLKKLKDTIEVDATSGVRFVITKKGVTRLSGLKRWADLVEVAHRDIVVFGNEVEDLELVQEVNQGYAVHHLPTAPSKKKTDFQSLNKNNLGAKLKELIDND